MTTQIKRRRGTTTEHSTFTGAEGEITIDTTKDTVVVHDGSTAGGHPLATESSIAGKVDSSGDSMTGNLSFGDNDKAIFGAGSDLQIYHNGTDSIISESTAGNLLIQGDNLYLQNPAGSLTYIRAKNGLEVDLRYNGSKKLATTSTGVDITGTLTSDVIQSSSTGNASAPAYSFDGHTTAGFYRPSGLGSSIGVATSGVQRALFANNGDLSLYEDTGTTPKFFWDASAESLGIGTSSPSATLELNSATQNAAKLKIGRSTAHNNYLQLDTSGGESQLTAIGASSVYGSMIFSRNNGTTTSESMRIDSSGNVGIGTSSPSAPLSVDSTGAVIKLNQSNVAADTYIDMRASSAVFGYDSSKLAATIQAGAGNKFISFNVNDNTFGDGEAMRILSNGNVAINHTSASSRLTVGAPDSGDTLSLLSLFANSGATGGSASSMEIVASSNKMKMKLGGSDQLVIGNSTSDFATFDASGSFMVGTTDPSLYDDTSGNGFSVYSTGIGTFKHQAVNSSDPCLILNDTGVDSQLLQFRKNGTTVGSIGVEGGDLTVGKAGSGLQFRSADPCVRPHNMTTNSPSDATVNLGRVNTRFKDLYLSGGVYLGGTGSANKLDDYETGTFNATATSSGSATLSVSDELYTKIGRIVHVSFTVSFSGSGSSGTLVVDDLPFASSSTYPIGIGREDGTDGYAVYGRITTGVDEVHIWAADSASNASAFKVASGNFRFSITYKCE
jgi:hypothetical protein